jgi:2-succinyl-5-enolpyruvyl-6-hydroxy-3-cyclohexene-1-carboxylate synthase
VIICGPRSPRGEFGEMLALFADASGYPVLADPISGLRFGSSGDGGYDSYLAAANLEKPQVIIRFGAIPTSQRLNDYVSQSDLAHYIHFAEDGEWSDDAHKITDFIQANYWLLSVADSLDLHNRTEWQSRFCEVERITWETTTAGIEAGDYFDGAAVYDVVDLIPPDSTLFVGNSLPVRLLDQFGKPTDKRIYVYANRGASGIDGNISTALGAGTARPDKPLVAIVGDITFYHDMNGLLAAQRNGVPVTIVLLNNDGGGIFHRLPIKDFDPAFTDLFVMPHGLQFEHAAKMYGLEYVRADDRESFRQAFSESVNSRLSRVIEVRTDVHHDLKRRQEIMDTVQQRIAELNL